MPKAQLPLSTTTILTLFVLLLSGTGAAQAQALDGGETEATLGSFAPLTEACVDPAAAAEMIIEEFEDEFLTLELIVGPEEICAKACRIGYRACERFTNLSRKCLRKSALYFGLMSKVVDCQRRGGRERQDCVQGVKQSVRSSKATVQADAEGAGDTCDSYFRGTCIDGCGHAPEVPCPDPDSCAPEPEIPNGDEGTCDEPEIVEIDGELVLVCP